MYKETSAADLVDLITIWHEAKSNNEGTTIYPGIGIMKQSQQYRDCISNVTVSCLTQIPHAGVGVGVGRLLRLHLPHYTRSCLDSLSFQPNAQQTH
jgi:hypothetical protein